MTLLKSKLPRQRYSELIPRSNQSEDWEEWQSFEATAYDVTLGEPEYFASGIWEHYVYARVRVEWGDWFQMRKRFATRGIDPPSKAEILADTREWELDGYLSAG